MDGPTESLLTKKESQWNIANESHEHQYQKSVVNLGTPPYVQDQT